MLSGRTRCESWSNMMSGPLPVVKLLRSAFEGRRFAAALLPRLFGTNPRSHHKGATGRVRTGDQRLPVLCRCQLGQDIPLYWLSFQVESSTRAPAFAGRQNLEMFTAVFVLAYSLLSETVVHSIPMQSSRQQRADYEYERGFSDSSSVPMDNGTKLNRTFAEYLVNHSRASYCTPLLLKNWTCE